MKNKRLRQFYASIRKTFVADCPRCNKHFYGFHSYAIHIKLDGKHYRYVCHRCAQELRIVEISNK